MNEPPSPALHAYLERVAEEQAAALKAIRHVRDRVGRPGRRLLDRAGQAVTLCGAPPTGYDFSRKSAAQTIAGGPAWTVECLPLLCPACRAILEKKGTRS